RAEGQEVDCMGCDPKDQPAELVAAAVPVGAFAETIGFLSRCQHQCSDRPGPYRFHRCTERWGDACVELREDGDVLCSSQGTQAIKLLAGGSDGLVADHR